MTTSDTKDRLRARLEPYGQQHLLDFWEELDDAQRVALTRQIEALDLAQVARLYASSDADSDLAERARRAESPPAVRLGRTDNAYDVEEARRVGIEALSSGQVGAVLVAGGQGSRLGFEHPKGMFPAGPVSDASLFQILIEKVHATANRYGVAIPLYVMTSPATDAETRATLEAHDRFGLAGQDLVIFCQGTMPAVDAQSGKLLLADRDRLFESPDGHGGMLAALERTGAPAGMRDRGIDDLFYFQVDNPLTTVCDPELIGYHRMAESQYTLQVVEKKSPTEKVGVVVSVDGNVQMIEYSDLPRDAAERRTEEGGLALWAGSIAVHVFDVGFLASLAGRSEGLDFHRALKTVSYMAPDGRLVDPDDPNAVKFERFIFDLLPHAERSVSVEVEASVAFAPIKNGSGAPADTPESVEHQMMALHRNWLRSAGAIVDDTVRVEISPLFALDAEQVREKIRPGTHVTEDTYFR